MNILKRIAAEFKVPKGSYCYKTLKVSISKDGFLMSTRVCSYWKYINDEKGARCELLKVDGDILVNDQCKICGVKEDLKGVS
jgi:hypothetical protein